MELLEAIYEDLESLLEDQTMIIRIIVQGNEVIQPWFEPIPREFHESHEDYISGLISDITMGNINYDKKPARRPEGPYDLYEYQVSCDEHGEIVQTLYSLEYQKTP